MKWHRQQLTICWRLQCAQSECNNPIRAQFVHSRGQNVGIRAEMNSLSSLQSAKNLVDVTRQLTILGIIIATVGIVVSITLAIVGRFTLSLFDSRTKAARDNASKEIGDDF